MEITKGIENYIGNEPIYLALGNFDGVHLGHKRLIQSLVDKANKDGIKSAALIFEPHPSKVLTPDKELKLLVTSEKKAELLEKLGLDILIYSPFTMETAKLSPQDFVERILVNKLHIKEAYIGFNYSFGYKGIGSPEIFKQLGEMHGFKVNITLPVKLGETIVSSSLIRKSLEVGDIITAQEMLGYEPIVEGRVIKGEQRGSKIGFPTANIEVNPEIIIPVNGVYASKINIENNIYNCVVNIGKKPTFHKDYPVSIEAHIIEFNKQIYDKNVTLYFLDKIREEKKFNGIDELVMQISKDKDKALELINIR